MKTIELKLYSFDELTEEAKNTAIKNYRNQDNDNCDFIYSDAEKTVEKFCEAFSVKTGRDSWLDCYTSHIDDFILNLTGLRLQKYLYNNFGSTLYKRKYLKHGENFENRPVKLFRMQKLNEINQGPNKGKFYFTYYSNLKKDTCCNLTGVCYDNDIMQPIYNFLEDRNPESNNTTFESLFIDCFQSLKKSLENECDYMNSDEYISEQLSENGSEFTENGQIY